MRKLLFLVALLIFSGWSAMPAQKGKRAIPLVESHSGLDVQYVKFRYAYDSVSDEFTLSAVEVAVVNGNVENGAFVEQGDPDIYTIEPEDVPTAVVVLAGNAKNLLFDKHISDNSIVLVP